MTLNIQNNISENNKKFIPISFFLNEKWLNVIEKTFDFRKKYFVFDYNKEKIILPFFEANYILNKIFISIPYSFNLNLKDINEKIIIKEILKFNKNLNQQNEIIIKSDFNENKGYINNYFKSKFNYYVVSLTKNFQNKFSKNIKRSFKNNEHLNFKFVKKYESKEFEEFFENYIRSSKKLQTFFYPKIFFLNLFKECRYNFFIINAYKKNVFLGGHLVLLDIKKKEAIYFCSSKSILGEINSIDKILLNHSMNICYKKKYELFNLGKVSKNNIGLNRFKEQFGSKKYSLNYFSLFQKNYAILDKKNIFKNSIKFFIKFVPLKIYIIFNNTLYKYLSIY